MFRRLLAAVFFAGFAAVCPISAAEKLPSHELGDFKNADELWHHLAELKRGPGREFSSQEEFKDYVVAMNAAAVEFVKRYPNDPRRWEAKMMTAQASAALLEMSGGKASPQKQQEVNLAIIAAPDAPGPVKTEARFGLIQLHLAAALETGKLSPENELEMAAFKRDFPKDGRVEAIDLLRVKFYQRTDPAKARALLQDLAKSKNPRVAAEAQAQLK